MIIVQFFKLFALKTLFEHWTNLILLNTTGDDCFPFNLLKQKFKVNQKWNDKYNDKWSAIPFFKAVQITPLFLYLLNIQTPVATVSGYQLHYFTQQQMLAIVDLSYLSFGFNCINWWCTFPGLDIFCRELLLRI